MRGESSESMAWKVRGSVMRAQETVKPLTTPSTSAARRSFISDHRLEQEGRADRGGHDRHHRDDACRGRERRAGETVAGGAAAGGPRADANQQTGTEQDCDLAAEREVRVEPGVAHARVGCAGEERVAESAEHDAEQQ